MRRLNYVLAALTAALVLAAGPSSAGAAPDRRANAHPYFDDQGTLAWYSDLSAAQEAGRASGKLILVEYGRRACCNCRTLVQRVLPSASVKSRVASLCVGLAANCDEPDPRVEAMFRKAMPDASMLPFVAVVSADLEFATGWNGAMDVPGCSSELTKAEAWHARHVRKPAPAAPITVAPAPRIAPAPQVVAAPAPASPRAPAPAARVAPTPVPSTAVPASTTTATAASRPAGAPSGASISASPAPTGTQAVTLAACRALLERAEAASSAGDHAGALRMDREAAALSIRVEAARWAVVLAKADAWAEKLLATAAAAALAGHVDEAEKVVTRVKHDAEGRGASIDAERGARAIATRRRIDASPAAARTKARADAKSTYRGTRWEVLFPA